MDKRTRLALDNALQHSPSKTLTLNIGNGYIKEYLEKDGIKRLQPRRFNLYMDIRDYKGVDIVLPWQSADLPKRTFHHIHASQTIEHLLLAAQLNALKRSCDWLIPGGILEVWTPDLEDQIRSFNAGAITIEWLRTICNGEQDYPENAHLGLHTNASLVELAEQAGFQIVSCETVAGSLALIARRPD
jgi:predicted SAM-dependent methyltransferase